MNPDLDRIGSGCGARNSAPFQLVETTNGTVDLMSARPRLAPPVAVSTTAGFRVFRPEAIDWIEADGNHVQLQVAGTSYPIRATFRETLLRLGVRFRQIHRGYAVNLSRIEGIHPNGDGAWVVALTTGTQLPLGRSYRRHLFAALTQL